MFQKTQFPKGSDSVRDKLKAGSSWEGTLNCKRKTGDFVPLDSKVIAVQLAEATTNQR